MKVDAAEQARTSIADFYQTYRNLIFKKAVAIVIQRFEAMHHS